jgi:hypothetical protein
MKNLQATGDDGMNVFTDWFHGTRSIVSQWDLVGRAAVKNNTPLHKGLFFTTSIPFATGCIDGEKGHVYRSTVNQGAHILDMTAPGQTCTVAESEKFRNLVISCRRGKGNVQAEDRHSWERGWVSGEIMKYLPRHSEAIQMQTTFALAMNERHTELGIRSFNFLQKLTRDCIEDIVEAAIKAGYQAVAGHEIQFRVTHQILIVLDPSILTPPVKV